MQENFKYTPFNKFVFRCPILPVNQSHNNFTDSGILKESVFLASPDLYDAFVKETAKSGELNLKTRLSLMKYHIRMSSRCTPFGLFAACGIGQLGDTSAISMEGINNYRSHTRLDMNFLCALCQYISNLPEVADKLSYYPNSSLYRVFKCYRYIEYKYKNSKRKHFLSEIEFNEYLAAILTICETGASKEMMVQTLLAFDFEAAEINEYLNELITNQVLVSDLDPTVTGEDLLKKLISRLDQLNVLLEVNAILKSISEKLQFIDSITPGRSEDAYKEIIKEIDKLNVAYERKFLFQSDMYVMPGVATLGSDVLDTVKDGLHVLNKLSRQEENQLLKKFKEDFYKRYEDEEVPLIEAMDSDIGLGFSGAVPGNTEIHPLIDGLAFVQRNAGSTQTSFNRIDMMLLEKYMQCINNGDKEVVITDEHIAEMPEQWDDLPITINAMLEVLKVDKEKNAPLVYIKSVGGSSAANLLGRFCHIDSALYNHVINITDKEDELIEENKILAEIVHLPESRIGNILYRPTIRKYEIPYLARQSVDNDYKLPVSDLMVSVPGGRRIRLRSKKLNKEIAPRLSTAHNFSNNALPVYHFLCLLQTEGLRLGVGFSWGSLVGSKEFYPRVRYKNSVLFLARWNFNAKDTKDLPAITHPDFFSKAIAFKELKNIPDKVWLKSGDNKLFIDFNDPFSVQLLFSEVRGENFVLEECSFDDNAWFIKQHSGACTNEVIISFYKNK
jgi:lantibiotic biosynthesis protein